MSDAQQGASPLKSDCVSELSELFPVEFMILVTGFQSDLIKHELYFGSYGLMRVTKEQVAREDLGRGYL